MTNSTIIPHLFRTEYGKLVSVLTKSFGIAHIEIAEDIASDTFLLALNTWPYKGVPPNPTAWLYTVAKNKTKNYLKRNANFQTKVTPKITSETAVDEIKIDFSTKNISDSHLQMLFAVCHPSISTEAQICLALRVVCGLGLNEIADAFFSNKETIHKRLQRAKEKLKQEQVKLEMPDEQRISERLDNVLHTIYLLFSEGYYSESSNTTVRPELCVEALNLNYLLLDSPITNNHATNALMSLMCFQSSRLEARKSETGSMVLYEDQDRNLWDNEFIEKGFHYLQQASKWPITSKYYLEASIAYWHTVDDGNPDKWTSILELYNVLLKTNHSPLVALNRIWAFSKVHGDTLAILEAEKLNLNTNHFYFMLLAKLYTSIDTSKALECLTSALNLCRTETERDAIEKQILSLR